MLGAKHHWLGFSKHFIPMIVGLIAAEAVRLFVCRGCLLCLPCNKLQNLVLVIMRRAAAQPAVAGAGRSDAALHCSPISCT